MLMGLQLVAETPCQIIFAGSTGLESMGQVFDYWNSLS